MNLFIFVKILELYKIFITSQIGCTDYFFIRNFINV
jgi:hypothetical protein